MSNNIDHFPPLIRALPAFEGAFDAFRLRAERCDVLFATYPGARSSRPTAMTRTTLE